MSSNLDTTGFNSPNGYNSPSFGTVNQKESGQAIALQPDGKIVMVGTIENNMNEYVVGIVRFNSNGSIDA